MPRAYSSDLRERALAAYEAGEGRQSEIARAYRIGERTLSGWLKTAREEGRRAPRPRRGGTEAGGRRGRDAGHPGGGAERRDARRVRRPAGGPHRGPAQPLGPVPGAEGAGPRPQEKALKAAERDREDVAEARRAWRAELAGVDPARLVFIDETGIDTRMTRAYARAAKGQRAVGKVPWGRWERLTVLGALALDGIVASRGVAAATGTAVFLAFAEEVLIPALRERPDALVVMDNLAAHKSAAVREALDRAGLAPAISRPTRRT